MRGFAGDRTGATALEFAMVAPVLIAMVIGVFNLGYALYCGAAVRHAIQQSSRALMFDPGISAATLKATVTGKLTQVPVENLQIAIATEAMTQSEEVKRISWTYDYMVYVPFLPSEEFEMGSNLTVPLPPEN